MVKDQLTKKTAAGKQKDQEKVYLLAWLFWATKYFFTSFLQLLDKRWPIHQ